VAPYTAPITTAWFSGNPEPIEAETWGVLQALTWLKDTDYHNIEFETDYKPLVDGLQLPVWGHYVLHLLFSKCS